MTPPPPHAALLVRSVRDHRHGPPGHGRPHHEHRVRCFASSPHAHPGPALRSRCRSAVPAHAADIRPAAHRSASGHPHPYDGRIAPANQLPRRNDSGCSPAPPTPSLAHPTAPNQRRRARRPVVVRVVVPYAPTDPYPHTLAASPPLIVARFPTLHACTPAALPVPRYAGASSANAPTTRLFLAPWDCGNAVPASSSALEHVPPGARHVRANSEIFGICPDSRTTIMHRSRRAAVRGIPRCDTGRC
jgi:hypothetical protein